MAVSAFIQDPHAVQPYGVDWTLDPGDTITVSTWTAFEDDGSTVTTDITVSATQFTNLPAPRTTVRLSFPDDSVIGRTFHVVNHIETAAVSEGDKTLFITCGQE